MKEKDGDVLKTVEQTEQNTSEKNNTIPDALKSTGEKEIKEESIHKKSCTAKNGTRPEETTNTAMNRIGSLTTNAQLQNQHLIKCEKKQSAKTCKIQ